jgi:hypothetical protein
MYIIVVMYLQSWGGISEWKAAVSVGGCRQLLREAGIMEYRAPCPLHTIYREPMYYRFVSREILVAVSWLYERFLVTTKHLIQLSS